MAGKKVLVVDDEPAIVELIKYHLEKEGFEALVAYDGAEGLAKARSEHPDLIILDVMLPKMDGFAVCQTIRQEQTVPIILLTAKGEEFDKVFGLQLGADDYVTKPFSYRELLARVKALLRRQEMDAAGNGAPAKDEVLTIGDVRLDLSRHAVTVRGAPVDLTPKEFDLLYVLAANRGRVMTRDFLLQKVWGYEYEGDTRTVDVHVRRLRTKIEPDPANPTYIETVHGVGYRIRGAGD
ncbi:MAG: response regulator transcription factor [Firmicutes bacterium]|nr:response regulator transcription factor [Bacillota bacterium]